MDPLNVYPLNDPNICLFYRTAIYRMCEGQKLIPGNDNNSSISENDGFSDMQNLFKNHLDANLIEQKEMKKNAIPRFKTKNKAWSRNNNNKTKKRYYSSATPVMWSNLSESERVF